MIRSATVKGHIWTSRVMGGSVVGEDGGAEAPQGLDDEGAGEGMEPRGLRRGRDGGGRGARREGAWGRRKRGGEEVPEGGEGGGRG